MTRSIGVDRCISFGDPHRAIRTVFSFFGVSIVQGEKSHRCQNKQPTKEFMTLGCAVIAYRSDIFSHMISTMVQPPGTRSPPTSQIGTAIATVPIGLLCERKNNSLVPIVRCNTTRESVRLLSRIPRFTDGLNGSSSCPLSSSERKFKQAEPLPNVPPTRLQGLLLA